MLVFYDFEVFKYDWLVVMRDPIEDTKTVIVNDKAALEKYYNEHKNDIWIGFNSRGYDQYILKGILCDINPYRISDWIINKGNSGYQYSSVLNKIPLLNYDISSGKTDYGLKTLECFMGEDIKETSVDFKINRKLTASEIAETIKYCDWDVLKLIDVFLLRKDNFDTHIAMINEFDLPLSYVNKTPSQLLAKIMGAEKVIERNDDYDMRVPDTLKLSKYKYIVDWFISSYKTAKAELDKDYNEAVKIVDAGVGSRKMLADMKKLVDSYELEYEDTFAKYFYNRNLVTEVSGVEHIYAWGGVHGAIPKFNYQCKDDELMIMADVTSLYPSLDIQYDLQSRNVKDKSIFLNIYKQNIEMKKNKDHRRPIYKLACNMTYGCKGDVYNGLYDKRNQNLTCVFGQLLLTDLIEKLEPHIVKLIQSNTDGILFLIKRKDFDLIDDIVYEWEQRTRLSMEFTYAMKIFQKDVNNYVMVTSDGHTKTKGAYVKELGALDYDLPIVNKAMVDFMVNGIDVGETINSCNDLVMFQKVFKLSGKYVQVWHNGEFTNNKCYRVFASKNREDTYLGKCKIEGGKIERFANTPEHCFIYNGSVKGVKVPNYLDKKWYVNLANERLRQFGVI